MLSLVLSFAPKERTGGGYDQMDLIADNWTCCGAMTAWGAMASPMTQGLAPLIQGSRG